ncbi:hypothetical protein B0A49_00037 [Cryomyces minteri]|uniref:Protein kinase domain-containing protein n=1 Tax=Cryomyces minteri TaxID=331657 RepID=A0A4U0Y249_9PEZI|nr:hypothetical protein B0A49_00037 [Cryomyces minteri]
MEVPVAYLQFRRRDTNQQALLDIRANVNFYVGRDPIEEAFHLRDPTISNRQLRIYSIVYEDSANDETLPLVYAEDLSTNGTYLRRNSQDGNEDPQNPNQLMGRAMGGILLSDGDELYLTPTLLLTYFSNAQFETSPQELDTAVKSEKMLFEPSYLLTNRKLGGGAYGSVYDAIHQKTQRQLACKIVSLSMEPETDKSGRTLATTQQARTLEFARYVQKQSREFDVLKDLSHPNIIALEKVYYTINNIYIFQELVTGGDLFSYLDYQNGTLSDVQAAVIIRQVLKVVEYLHDRDVVHRDIKPENVLITSLADGARIVLTDFGHARYLPSIVGSEANKDTQRRRMFSAVGTYDHVAPEIYRRNNAISKASGYSRAVDMWSVGSVTALLLTGEVLFANPLHERWNQNPGEVLLSLAAECDLNAIDHSQKWESVEFEAVYERAIKDWKPRRKVFNVVEFLGNSTLDLADKLESLYNRTSQDRGSRFFSQPPTVFYRPSVGTPTLDSPIEHVQSASSIFRNETATKEDIEMQDTPENQFSSSSHIPGTLSKLRKTVTFSMDALAVSNDANLALPSSFNLDPSPDLTEIELGDQEQQMPSPQNVFVDRSFILDSSTQWHRPDEPKAQKRRFWNSQDSYNYGDEEGFDECIEDYEQLPTDARLHGAETTKRRKVF